MRFRRKKSIFCTNISDKHFGQNICQIFSVFLLILKLWSRFGSSYLKNFAHSTLPSVADPLIDCTTKSFTGLCRGSGTEVVVPKYHLKRIRSSVKFCTCRVRPKEIDPLFSVDPPYIKHMCAYPLFIGNMPHIAFFHIKIYK